MRDFIHLIYHARQKSSLSRSVKPSVRSVKPSVVFSGGGIGPLVGGLLVHSLGYRLSFQILSAICAGVGLLYFLLYQLYLKKRNNTLDLADSGTLFELTNLHKESL